MEKCFEFQIPLVYEPPYHDDCQSLMTDALFTVIGKWNVVYHKSDRVRYAKRKLDVNSETFSRATYSNLYSNHGNTHPFTFF